MKMKSVYVAGPDVFRADAADYFNRIRNMGEIYKFDILTPFDNDVADIPEEDKPTYIGKGNFALVDAADIVVANLMQFRGVCVDDGTCIEIGYGFGKGKIVCGYTTDLRTLKNKTDLHPAFSSEQKDVFPIVEDFGLTCNLMITNAIKMSGGIIAPSFEDVMKFLYWKRALK